MKSISMSITEEAFDLWDQWKRNMKLTQGDAMTKLITDNIKPKEPCAAELARQKRDEK